METVDLKGLYLNTIIHIQPTINLDSTPGVKTKNLPEVLVNASKSKSEAKKQARLMMKRFKLNKQGDRIVNTIDMIELITNY